MIRLHTLAIAALALVALPHRAAAQAGDPAHGEPMFRACAACHSLEPNRNMTGPSLADFCACGSKRTIVFGLAKDLLYQGAPWVNTMPYGSDFGPLGDGHSVTRPSAGSSRPR